jgi:predicted component of type VI protein secretion system
MSKLTLQYEDTVLREFTADSGLTIGRLPDNVVVVDNPAVSGRHARVVREGDQVVLEDLSSTNGTFVNGRAVTRHVLQHGDEVLVGKHELVFDRSGAAPSSGWAPRRLGVLRVVSGRADHPEYDLDAHTSLIGRSGNALVRLRGWLKPSVAVAIARSGDGYVATRVGGRPQLNDEPLTGRPRLQEGDLLQVGGLMLEFAWKDRAATESAA